MAVYSESVGDQLTIDGQEIPREEVVKGKTPPPLPAEVEKKVTEQDVLDRAADLLEEFGWCQEHLAKDEQGEEASYCGKRAVSFCIWGATARAYEDLGLGAWNLYGLDVDWKAVALWNDSSGCSKDAAVLALRSGLPQFRN